MTPFTQEKKAQLFSPGRMQWQVDFLPAGYGGLNRLALLIKKISNPYEKRRDKPGDLC